MQNLTTSLNGNILTVTLDVTKDLGVSKSGKSRIVATTGGNKAIKTPAGDVMIGINAYRKL